MFLSGALAILLAAAMLAGPAYAQGAPVADQSPSLTFPPDLTPPRPIDLAALRLHIAVDLFAVAEGRFTLSTTRVFGNLCSLRRYPRLFDNPLI